MQISKHDHHGQEKPVGNIDVAGFSMTQGEDKINRIGDPDNGQQNIKRPLQLGVFLTLRNAQWQSDHGANDI